MEKMDTKSPHEKYDTIGVFIETIQDIKEPDNVSEIDKKMSGVPSYFNKYHLIRQNNLMLSQMVIIIPIIISDLSLYFFPRKIKYDKNNKTARNLPIL